MVKNILSLDLGKGSLGVALSRTGSFTSMLPNIRFHAGDYSECLKKLEECLEFEKVERIVIGYPTYPSGDPCEMTPIVEAFIPKLEAMFPGIEIIKVDERYSTVEASEILHRNNISAKKQKEFIDSAAALVILERYLRNINQL